VSIPCILLPRTRKGVGPEIRLSATLVAQRGAGWTCDKGLLSEKRLPPGGNGCNTSNDNVG
jgi:hypothetical protein